MPKFDGARILVLDDDKATRRALGAALEAAGYAVTTAHAPIEAYDAIVAGGFDALVFDIRLGEMTGVDVYRKLRAEGVDTPVIFMSGTASLSEAVEAVRMGAFDFLEKPFVPEKLQFALEHCLEMRELRAKLEAYEAPRDFVGESPLLQKIRRSIAKVAPTQTPVLITGESGTGKELIAREIHESSRVKGGPFVKVNCSAVPENLFESEFFGHEKGAFTGAHGPRKGHFEQASGGTLLLDEIGDMPLACQAKILRALQSGEIQKLGSEKSIPVKVRVIASTNRDLERDVRDGRFREDLFYRLNVFPISSPSLRERRGDVPLLAKHFLDEYTRANGMPTKHFDDRAISRLSAHAWPGNIRELRNVVERMAILGGQTLTESDVPEFLVATTPTAVGRSLRDFRKVTERDYIVKTLIEVRGNISEAAQLLEIERTHLHKKIQDYGIQKKEFFV